MHLLKILELLHILRNNPEPAEVVIAEAPDPAFVAAEVGPAERSIVAGGSTATARVGRALVIIIVRLLDRVPACASDMLLSGVRTASFSTGFFADAIHGYVLIIREERGYMHASIHHPRDHTTDNNLVASGQAYI